jgi:hypothetical protein
MSVSVMPAGMFLTLCRTWADEVYVAVIVIAPFFKL